jgi:FixJ family two-component response regulator
VPHCLRPLKLAEQHCFAAIHDERARARLMAVYAAQLAAADAAGDMEDLEGEMPEGILDGVDVALASGGPQAIADALSFALEQDAAHTAVKLIDTLKSMGGGGEAGTAALRSALGSGYKSVRYHAAFALSWAGDHSDSVIQTLVSALGEDALRTVLVVDDHDPSRNALQSMLGDAGYTVVSADNGGLGFLRSRSLPPKDLIILRAGMADVTLDQFVYDSDFRASASPILILADSSNIEEVRGLYDGKGKVAGFLEQPIRNTALEEVAAAMGDLNHERAMALKAAEMAAGILAHTPREHLQPAAGELVTALDRTEESVLGPVLTAVGRVAIAAAAPKVAQIFADSGNSEEIRVAAANALAGIFAGLTRHPGADVVDPLENAALNDDSSAIRVAASRALGSAGFMDDNARAMFLRKQRGG